MFKPSKRTLDNLVGVHPKLVQVILEGYKYAEVDYGVVAKAVRTQAEQDDLYAQGRTKPGKIVTWTTQSKHIPGKDGLGHAVDVTAFLNGQPSWQDDLYHPIIWAIKTAAEDLHVKIECGIDWKKPDFGHVQLADGYKDARYV